jgi:hypothetical protein
VKKVVRRKRTEGREKVVPGSEIMIVNLRKVYQSKMIDKNELREYFLSYV